LASGDQNNTAKTLTLEERDADDGKTSEPPEWVKLSAIDLLGFSSLMVNGNADRPITNNTTRRLYSQLNGCPFDQQRLFKRIVGEIRRGC